MAILKKISYLFIVLVSMISILIIPSHAKEIQNIVYTAMNESSSHISGDGTKENPYSRFEDAVENVADGGIIYIVSSKGAFLNIQPGELPFVIDKSVTIQSDLETTQASLLSRSAGIMLGGDVTFKNIEIDFAYRYHDYIFANGHSLTLNNTSRNLGYSSIDIIGGGLYDLEGNHIGPETGQNAQINLYGKNEFGNIYAGSINGEYNGDTSICIQNTKNANLGDIYASGAKENYYDKDNWFDFTEPLPPHPDGNLYPVSGKVDIVLDNASIANVDGSGAKKGTNVSLSTTYLNSNLSLKNLAQLTVNQGALQPKELTSWENEKMNIVIHENGALDLSNYNHIEFNDFVGGGRVILGNQSTIKILGNVTGITAFETTGGYNGYSGLVLTDHVYIETNPKIDGGFSYNPYPTQSGFTFEQQSNGQWIVKKGDNVVVSYWCEDSDMGNVSIDWETFHKENGIPEGAKAIANPGYYFLHWEDEERNIVSQDEYFVPQKQSGVYVEAVYEAIFAANCYHVSFDANGGQGTAMPEQQFFYNESQNLLKNSYEKFGYTFDGWNTEKDGTGIHYLDMQEGSRLTTKQNDNVVLYAQWIPNNYIIKYNLDGGTNNQSNPSTYQMISDTITLKNPTRKGYTFNGWYSDSAYETKVTQIPKGSTGNKTLYAKWTMNKYTIQYNLNGGTNNQSNPTSYNVIINTITLKNPTRKGYTFNGWYSDSAYKTKVTQIPKGSTENKTLYAKWTMNKYTIQYNLNGGTNNQSNPTSYNVITNTITLKNPTRKGYTFNGWYSDSAYKTKVTQISKGSTGNKTLYAKWTMNKYTIKYNLNGGTNKQSNPKSYNVTTNTITLKNPTRKGYTFNGWYSQSTYKTKVTQIAKGSTGNKTLYAKWTKVSVAKAKTPTLTNVKGKKLKITYKATTGAKGYQIQYSTKKNFSKATSKNLTGKSTTYTLIKGKTYHVRVRAYKLDSTGSKVYGKWSTVKSKKIVK